MSIHHVRKYRVLDLASLASPRTRKATTAAAAAAAAAAAVQQQQDGGSTTHCTHHLLPFSHMAHPAALLAPPENNLLAATLPRRGHQGGADRGSTQGEQPRQG